MIRLPFDHRTSNEVVEKHARELANEDHLESQPKIIPGTIFNEFIILLWLFGLEVPQTAESLEMWSSWPDGVCVQHPLKKWQW